MSYADLKKALIAKTGLTRQAVEYRARQVQKKYGPMKTEHAMRTMRWTFSMPYQIGRTIRCTMGEEDRSILAPPNTRQEA